MRKFFETKRQIVRQLQQKIAFFQFSEKYFVQFSWTIFFNLCSIISRTFPYKNFYQKAHLIFFPDFSQFSLKIFLQFLFKYFFNFLSTNVSIFFPFSFRFFLQFSLAISLNCLVNCKMLFPIAIQLHFFHLFVLLFVCFSIYL